MNAGPVVLINAFEVPEGEDAAFLGHWERARAFLSTQAGYLLTRLHRSIAPTADFRFANVAPWKSAEAFQAATTQPEFTSTAIPLPFHASLCEVARGRAMNTAQRHKTRRPCSERRADRRFENQTAATVGADVRLAIAAVG